MTPKEKAEELVDRYSRLNLSTSTKRKRYNSKQCALIAVDEILNSYVPVNEYNYTNLNHDNLTYRFNNYYQEVKNEIEKL